MSDEHLHSAARALEGIMRDLDPEATWVFTVAPPDGAVESCATDELARRRSNAPGHDTEGMNFDAA